MMLKNRPIFKDHYHTVNVAKMMLTTFAFFCTQISYANPEGGVVAAGQAEIVTHSPNTVQINQASDKAIINWQSYHVGQNEHVIYQQPGPQSITLNRINPASGVSQIYGKITANGQVWLMNPAGIWFGPGAHVNVAGLLATTAGISDADFMAGKYHFQQSPEWNGAVINEGMIVLLNNGLAALVAPGAVNRGQIIANLGTAVLASSNEYTIDFTGDSLVTFAIGNDVQDFANDQNGQSLKHAVENSGTIIANGGKIQMAASVGAKVLDNAINMNGIAVADSVGIKNGEIIFSAGSGKVTVSGTVTASGKKSGESGGVIKVLGNEVTVKEGALIDASGDVGGGVVLIGGNAHGEGVEQNAKSVAINKNVAINADAYTHGNGGTIVIWSDEDTHFYGNISARGGAESGNGGWVETSGKEYLDVNNSSVDLRASNGETGTWLLDPTNIYIALNQASATLAGMTGLDNTANYGTTTFQATGAIIDSLLTISTLQAALATASVVVTTTNASGTGLGNIVVVDAISWLTANTLTLTAANNIALNAAITTGAAGSALILNAVGNVTQTAAIGGSGGVTKQGAGTLTLSQANTYTGVTTVTTGVVSVQNNAAFGSVAGGTTVASGAAIEIDGSGLNIAEPITSMIGTGVSSGGALRNVANSNEWSGAVVLGAGGATINSVSGLLTLSGGITGATRPLTLTGNGNTLINSIIGTTTGTLTKNGNGLLTLTAANTYSGATAVNAGQLTLSGGGTATSTAFSVASGAKLTLDNVVTNNADRIANALTLTGGEFEILGNAAANTSESVGTLTLPSGYSMITITPDVGFNTQLTFSAYSRTAGAGILFRGVNLGANTVASLTANNSNIVFTAAPTLTGVGGALSGTTTVNILGGAIGDGGAAGNVGSGSDFVTYNPTGGSVNGLRPLLASEYAAAPAANVNLKLTANRTANDTFSLNSLLLSGGVTYDFDSLAGANTLTLGAAALSGNVLSIGGSNVIQTTTSPSGGLAFGSAEAKIFAVSDLLFGSNVPVAGTGSLTKHGAGTLEVDRSVAISGGIRVNSGVLLSGINNAFSTAQALTVLAPGTLNLNGFNNSITTLTMNSGSVSGANIVTGAGTLTLGGAVTLNANGSGAVGAGISGNLALGGATRTFTVNDGVATNDLVISALISDGVAGLTKAGNGGLSLSGANTYAGVTTVSAGTLEAASAGALGATTSGTIVSGTLLINNAVIGSEVVTINNGSTLSATGTAELAGNIILGGTAAARTISALLAPDILTLTGTIDGGAAALTIAGLGTVIFENTVGATTALTSLTTNAGSTLAVDGGSVRTSGSQTYNGIVTMLAAAATFEVTAALSDILMPNTLNNISNTITYAVSGLGSIRDITLANNSASAVVPTLPTGLRNLSLRFNSAGMDLPALSLTGTLSAATAGGNLTQSGALVITGVTTLASGAFDTTLLNAGNNFSTLTVNGGNNVSVRDSNAISIGSVTSAVSGNFSVNAGGAISDGARISTATLTTSSVGGVVLDFANHTISNFNATNITSGAITLINTIPLTLTGISQSGGGTTVSITNTGLVSVPDGVTIGSGTTLSITADDLNLNTTGAIASGTTTSITQRLAGGSIGLGDTAGTMTISGAELQRISATGLTLTNSTDGAIFVDGISALNSANISGTTTLTATTGTLGSVSFLNGSSSFRALTVSGDAGISIGANLATTVGAMAFTSVGGSLSVLDGVTALSATTLALTANDLNLNTTGALTATSTMSVTQNVASGSIGLGNTSGTMTISGSELQRMTTTGLTLTNSTDGAIIVDGISSANSANISGTTTLTATTGTLGAISFVNNASAFRTLAMTADAGISLAANVTTTVGSLSFTSAAGALSVADGVTAFSNTALAVSTNDLNLNVSGALTSTTTMSVAQSLAGASIGVGNTPAAMTISGSELQRLTATTLTLTTPTNGSILIDGVAAGDTANIAGAIALTATAGAGSIIAQNNSSLIGNQLTMSTDNFTVNNGITLATNNTPLSLTTTDINLNATGFLSSGSAAMSIVQQNVAGIGAIGLGNAVGTLTIDNTELQHITAGTLAISTGSSGGIDGTILVDGVTGTATSNVAGATTLTATAGTLGAISFQNSTSTFTNGLIVTTDGNITVDNGVTLATTNSTLSLGGLDLNLNATGMLNSGTGATNIRAVSGTFGLGLTSGTMTLNSSKLSRIFAGNLTITNSNSGLILVDGVSANDFVNISGTITLDAVTGGNGNISFQNNPSTFTNLIGNATAAIAVDVPVTTSVGNLALNSDVTGNAGPLNLNANLTSAGSISLTAPGTAAGIVLGASVALTGNGVTIGHALDGAFNLDIDAGAGDLTFSENVGSISRLGTLTIINVNDVINNGVLNVTSFNQLAGNVTAFGSGGIDATGSVIVNAANVTGGVNVTGLSLNTNAANLTGFVNGLAGEAAIGQITLLNTITAGTHFFDGIDMFSQPIPPDSSSISPQYNQIFPLNLIDPVAETPNYGAPIEIIVLNEPEMEAGPPGAVDCSVGNDAQLDCHLKTETIG